MNLTVKKYINVKLVLFIMMFFQLVWLLGIWITRATDKPNKLLILGVASVIGFLLVKYLNPSYFETIGAWIDRLAGNPRHFLILLLILLLVGGIPYATMQRVWPFDETSNYKAAQLIDREGLGVFFEKYTLFNYLSNRHPPLIFLINGLAISIFGNSLLTLRMVSLAFSFAMLTTSYYLASNLFRKKTGVLTTIFLITSPLIFRESTAGLIDVHATFFFTLSLLLALKLAQRSSWMVAIGLGVALGLGFLTKYMILFIIPMLVVFFLLMGNHRTVALPTLLSFSLAGSVLLLWAWYGSLIGVRLPEVAGFSPSDLFESQLATNTVPVPEGIVVDEINISLGFFITTESGRDFLFNSLLTRLPSGLGVYNVPLLLLGAGIFIHRIRRETGYWFILLCIAITSILLVLTLPDHRYFMVIFPALAMIMAHWVEDQSPKEIGQITLLSVIYQIGTLYLMIDWNRTSELFINY